MENTEIGQPTFPDDKFLNALADNFRLQESIINSTQLAILSTTPQGIINSFNKAAETMLGYASTEVLERSSPILFVDIDDLVRRAHELSTELRREVEPTFDVFTAKLSHSTSSHSDWKIVRKDRSVFPGTVTCSALLDEQEELFGYVFIIENISEKKEADARAAASERKFRMLAENIPGVIYLCHNDEHYSMIYVNDQIESLTGYAPHEFLERKVTFASLIHQENAETTRAFVEESLLNNKSFKIEYRLGHRDGSWKWVEEVGIGVYHEGHLQYIEGFIMDITHQKAAQQQLQKIAEENTHVFNNPVSLNAVANREGYFKRLAPSWHTLVGWTREELMQEPFISFVHPEDRYATLKASRFVQDGSKLTPFENRFRCKDGSYKWLLWGAAFDAASQLIYASALDITERKQSEENLLLSKRNLETIAVRLQEQNRQLDEFAHIISHNLRSPVGNIQALINLLNQTSSIDDYRLIFDKLKKVSKNLSETMNDLMDTIKVRENVGIERTELKFKEILDRVVQTLEGDLIRAEASVTFDFNEATTLYYPKAYLESIFQNLLTNSLKYRSKKRKPVIHFQTTMTNHSVELRVSDNGLGIDLEKFGDKLFGLHKTFHEHEEARGVGLFLIKTQVEAMGGSISAQSSVDTGTTFIIRF